MQYHSKFRNTAPITATFDMNGCRVPIRDTEVGRYRGYFTRTGKPATLDLAVTHGDRCIIDGNNRATSTER